MQFRGAPSSQIAHDKSPQDLLNLLWSKKESRWNTRGTKIYELLAVWLVQRVRGVTQISKQEVFYYSWCSEKSDHSVFTEYVDCEIFFGYDAWESWIIQFLQNI